MDTLHITTPADLVGLIGHSLGYWPHESLVCISLQNRMGATLRLDLPTTPDPAHMYARKVCGYLRGDQDATAAVFAIFTNTSRDNNSEALFGPLVETLAQQLALAGTPIQAGRIVGPTAIAEIQDPPRFLRPRHPAHHRPIERAQRRTHLPRQPNQGEPCPRPPPPGCHA